MRGQHVRNWIDNVKDTMSIQQYEVTEFTFVIDDPNAPPEDVLPYLEGMPKVSRRFYSAVMREN